MNKILVFIILSLFIISCSSNGEVKIPSEYLDPTPDPGDPNPTPDPGDPDIEPDPNPDPNPNNNIPPEVFLSPLSILIFTKYEGKETGEVLAKACFLSPAASVGDTLECNLQIDELTLYYSDLKFVVATKDKQTCELISFIPYFYLKSNSAVFPPDAPGGEDPPEPIDCSALSKKECWGGAAPVLLEDFPVNTSRYFLPADGLSRTYELPSINTLRQQGADRSLNTNVPYTNNLPASSRSTPVDSLRARYAGSIPDGYGGSITHYHDYQILCEDEWANTLYGITLTIGDDDSDGIAHDSLPGKDRFWDWGQ